MSSGSPSHFTVDQSGCQPQLLPIHSANSTIQPPTCLLCDWIILRVTIQPWVTLMNLEIRSTDLNNSPCKRHSNISKAIKEYSKHLTSGRLVIVATKPNQFEFSHWERHSLLFILSLKEAESQPLSETAIIDPHWICASDMTDWKSNCQMKHATICSDLELRSSFRPNLVIDTWEMCLKRIDNEARFVALSYLWGNTPTFTTITSNVHDLQRPGALNVPAVLERLPQTIQDAIKLTPILKERYLWVDSLCIIQDDQLNSSHEINNMSSVYANACVTIVAANGDDSSYGLRGIKGVSKERNTSESTFSFTPHYTASITPSRPHIRLEETRWQQRGWTFQENLFSARKLIFANERV